MAAASRARADASGAPSRTPTAASSSQVGLDTLPDDILVLIFAGASVADGKSLRLACRRFPPFLLRQVFRDVAFECRTDYFDDQDDGDRDDGDRDDDEVLGLDEWSQHPASAHVRRLALFTPTPAALLVPRSAANPPPPPPPPSQRPAPARDKALLAAALARVEELAYGPRHLWFRPGRSIYPVPPVQLFGVAAQVRAQLRVLTLGDTALGDLVGGARGFGPFPRLECLELRHVGAADEDMLADFIAQHGRLLRSVAFYGCRLPEAAWEQAMAALASVTAVGRVSLYWNSTTIPQYASEETRRRDLLEQFGTGAVGMPADTRESGFSGTLEWRRDGGSWQELEQGLELDGE